MIAGTWPDRRVPGRMADGSSPCQVPDMSDDLRPETPPPSVQQPPSSWARPPRRTMGLAGVAGYLGLAIALVVGGMALDRSLLAPPAGTPSGPVATTPGGSPGASPDGLALITDAWDLLHTKYVGRSSLDDTKLAYAAISAMTQAVGDTGHTTFLTPSDLTAEQAALTGQYVGIGALLDTAADGRPLIVGVFSGSPAEKAGLHAGDEIVAVDGKPTAGMTIDAVTPLVRGPKGTTVTLTIAPGGKTPTREVRIVRATVTIPVVEWTMVPGTTVADIKLDQFSQGATDKLIAAIRGAQAKGATAIVFDLRADPGGLVDEAIGVASQFLASGTVFISEDAAGTKTPSDVRPGGVATKIPLVVLVDGATASAAEIVAGALQDAGRAKIVGQTTFGTGTVLNQFDLPDGSALRIGTVQWLTPNGRQIWHHGITPDVVVSLPSGQSAFGPAEIGKLSASAVGSMADSQFLAALKLVTAPR